MSKIKAKIRRDIEYSTTNHNYGTFVYSNVTTDDGVVFGIYCHNAIKKLVNDEIIYSFKNVEVMHKSNVVNFIDGIKGNLDQVVDYLNNMVLYAAKSVTTNEYVTSKFRDMLEDLITDCDEYVLETGLTRIKKVKIECYPANEGRIRVIATEYHINGNVITVNDSFEDKDIVFLVNAVTSHIEDINNKVIPKPYIK